MTDRLAPVAREAGFSFCIITDGRRTDALHAEIESIRALQLPAFEIIVAGAPATPLPQVRVLHAPELAHTGRLGAMRNLACRAARYDLLVVADDDLRFHADFARGIAQAAESWDVLCVRLLNPDGSRYWDWATFGGPRGHTLLDYEDDDPFVYVTGGLAVMRAAVHDRVPWDDARRINQFEDVEWSQRLRAAGLRIRQCPHATVTHEDARYSQQGTGVAFRQDLTFDERVAADVTARGFYRPLPHGERWMSAEGTLSVAPDPARDRTLHFALASTAPALMTDLVEVTADVGGHRVATFQFRGAQSYAGALPVPAGTSLALRLRANRTAPAQSVGLFDERDVSVMLHELTLQPASP
jgi:hypothetical protein